jgi:para-nitrobenzyl esterase
MRRKIGWEQKVILQGKLLVLALLCFAICATTTVAATLPQTIKIDSGDVSGVAGTNSAVMSFKGIPFAAPPVGNLRWKPPMAPAKWSGVLKADHFSASCPQQVREGEPNPGASPYTAEFRVPGAVSEDCLYLNVWTPAKRTAGKLPVMVFFYGGGFSAGSASVPAYDGEGLASKSVVVVTLNYRLGLLGFLAAPELDAESPHHVSGNYGTLDQIEALKWISRNIAAFGGDLKRVTIFGQSAGGGSVHFVSVSPLARGLFARAIVESATMDPGDPLLWQGAMSYRKLSEAEKNDWDYLRKAGIDSMAKLRAMSMEQILAMPRAPFPPAFFSPVVDGYVLPQTFSETYAQRKQADVPFMVGTAAEDLSGVPRLTTTLAEYKKWAQDKFGPMAEEFLKLYPAATDEEAGIAKNLALHDQNRITKVTWAEKYQKGVRSKIFVYFWNHPLPGPYAEKFGAFHTSEVPYVMKSLANGDHPYTDNDWKIAGMMSQYWANFAATGDPNGKGLPEWPAFTTASGKTTMQLGDGSGPISAATDARIDFFRRWFASRPQL